MPTILLNMPYLTVHNRDTLLVTSPEGWIERPQTGLFHRDTRYLSNYQFTINGFDPRYLGASRPRYFSVTLYYTNPRIGVEPHLVAENSLLLKVTRHVLDGVHEDIELTNFAGKPVSLWLDLALGADFADIFQVRGLERIVPRLAQADWDPGRAILSLSYRNGGFVRALHYCLHHGSSPPLRVAGRLAFALDLAPGDTWRTCADLYFDDGTPLGHLPEHNLVAVDEDVRAWRRTTTTVRTPDSPVAQAYDRAVIDLASLRLEEVGGGRWFPAVGVPWYTAVFGRDALITALQSLPLYCPFGSGVLERLARLQGTKVDPFTEEEPGKLPHELRFGELAATGRVPHTPYYGTVDAPLLYVVLLHEVYRFTADLGILRDHYEAAVRCLSWAERYGDINGDGFIEYRPVSPKGYRNQGWKDAFDAVVYPNGALVEPPIAICEVQGYHYDALRRMAVIARLLGREEEALAYQRRAEELYVRFNDVYWLEPEGIYAYGLDPRGRPIATVASNAGHLLWSGIVPAERAPVVAARLLAPDMFSGWGIRTLSADNPAYDPVSYQRGSVWPHDNSIIALGCKRYGLWREANRVAEAIFDASAYYPERSLPELYAGIPRSAENVPVPYVEANAPQAWAAGSVVMLVQAMLGLEPDPSRRRLLVAPTLPEWLPELSLGNLAVFGHRLDLRARGVGLSGVVEATQGEGGVPVRVRPGDSPFDPVSAFERGEAPRED